MTLEREHDEHSPPCSAVEFDLRGVLATKLTCWHRLTEEEAQNLMEFVRGLWVRTAEPAKQCAKPEQCKNTFCAPPCPGCNPAPTQQPVLVRDLAEILGATVPEVCDELAECCGGPRRSANMAVSGVEALAVAAQLKQAVQPAVWVLTETLAKRKTTTRGFLWFSNPQNCSWTALYTRAAQQPNQQPLTELVEYILQDDIHNRLTPRVIDIAYSAWSFGRSGKNKDDGGPCDWFNDTKPMVTEQLQKIRKDLAEAANGITSKKGGAA